MAPKKRCRTGATGWGLRWCAVWLIALAGIGGAQAGNPHALWQIVHGQCVPHAEQHDGTGPCAVVDENAGYALLKDLRGPLQYLLIPTARIHGIESPALLAPNAQHYVALAWRARWVMAKRFGHPIPDDDILLALNSHYGRSQDQLHIHISCIDPGVKKQLERNKAAIQRYWHLLPVRLAGHRYIARRVSPAELRTTGAVHLLAHYDDARRHMGAYGLALTDVDGIGLVLLATHVDRPIGNFGSTEELDSHACHLLPGIKNFHTRPHPRSSVL